MQTDREKITYQIGERIRRYRAVRGMSQETLAFASEINPTYLGRLERGEKCPTVDTLYKLSSGLKIPLSELLDISAEIQPSSTEAMHRIVRALDGLSEKQAVEIAAVVEQIASMLKN